VFAHKYCHLLSYYIGFKDSWLEEGIADWAVKVVGYDDPTLDPEDPQFPGHLNVFHGYAVQESFGGPAAYSFMIFLEARFGQCFFSDLHNDPSAYSVSTFQEFLDTETEGICLETC
jgi:hypothetical protein